MTRPRPSEVVWQDRDSAPVGPVPGGPRPTPGQTAQRILDGEDWWFAVRELLDGLAVSDDVDPVPPRPVSPRVDAYLAAVIEHHCAQRRQPAPDWVQDPSRFLDHFWWPDGNPAFQALCLVESPAAFRRRGIFIGATTLQRV